MAQYTINFSTNANEIIRDIERVSGKVAEVARTGKSVQISLDATPLKTAVDTTFRELDKQISSLQRRLAKTQIGGPGFQIRAAQIGTLQGVRERGGMQAASIQLKKQAEAFDIGSAERLQRVLQAARMEASQIAPNTNTWVELQRQIGQIQGQIKATDRAAESIQLQAQLGALSPGSLNALETKLIVLRNRAREISPNTTEWKELNKEISKSEQALEKQTRRPLTQGQRFGAAGGAFLYGGGLGGGAGSALGGIAGGLLGGVPGAFTGAAAGQLIDNLAQQAAGIATFIAEINKSKIALAGVTKDIGDYQNALSAAQQAGQLFLIPIKDSIGQFTKLQASVAGAGYQTETTRQIFRGIASAIVATGGNTEDLNGALRATAQVFSKGKVTAEELRGQIGERLPGAFTIFAQATGRSTQQLDEDLQKGKVNLNDFVKFANELFKRYGSTAEILAKAPENAGARLEVALQAATYEYLGMFQVIGAAFQSYAADLVNFVTQNKSAIATTIAEFVVFAKDLYSIFESLVQALFPVFKSLFTFMFSNFAKGLDALATLAEETRRAAGGPEQRAQKQVETLYPNSVDRALYGAQAYREALQVELQYEKGAPGRRKTRNQRVSDMEKVLFPQFTPGQFGKGLGTGKIVEGLDGQGKDAATKRKNYVSQLSKIYQEELQEKLLYIDQDASLSDRQREIQKAAESFRFENLIAEAEYAEKTGAKKTKNIANLSQYLKESKRLYDLEKAQIQARYEGVVTKPLRDMLGEDRNAQIELQASIASLASGKDKLSQVEKRQMQIKQALSGLDDMQIEKMKPLIDLILQQAKAVDISREAYERANKALEDRKRLEENLAGMHLRVSAAGQGLMAGYYGSAAQTYQTALQQPGATPEYARQMAELETRAMQLESVFGGIQNAIGGVGDAFGTMMTQGVASLIQGTATAQEVFSNFLKAVGDALLQAAAQMIATYIAIGIAKAFAGLSGGGGKADLSGTMVTDMPVSQMPAGMQFAEGGIAIGGFQAFADGGMVNGPTLGLVGEGGEPEYIIPQSKMRGAMERYGSGARGASVIPAGSDSNAGGDAMAAMMSPIDVRYTVERINSVDYVTADQFQAGLQQAAKQGATQGEQRTLRRLQMSASTRRRVGI